MSRGRHRTTDSVQEVEGDNFGRRAGRQSAALAAQTDRLSVVDGHSNTTQPAARQAATHRDA